MSAAVKHWVDVLTPFALALATVATPFVTFVTSLLGAIWYGIRLYDWWKGRKLNANVRHD